MVRDELLAFGKTNKETKTYTSESREALGAKKLNQRKEKEIAKRSSREELYLDSDNQICPNEGPQSIGFYKTNQLQIYDSFLSPLQITIGFGIRV